MAQTAPSKDKTDNRTDPSNLVPPDERFWQHYSPHGEFPLSSVGSLVVHLLAFGLLALMAWLTVVLFNHSSRSLPVEAVRLDLGGGGGNPRGDGEGANNGAAPKEATEQTNEKPADNTLPDEAPKNIKVEPDPRLKQDQFEDPSKRVIQKPDSSSNSTFNRLRDTAARIQPPGSPESGRGKGGTGKGGGSGDGEGTGIGSGKGPGVATPTQREKRMLRWSMLFKVDNSAQYVAQLKGLGAIIAVPVGEDGSDAEYQVVDDLSARPAKLIKKDIREIQRMVYWKDDKTDSVRGVMSVLGLRQVHPSHFLAFMPKELEKKLLDLEINYLNRNHRNRKEDDILSTKFEIKVRGGKYEPVVVGQQLNK